VAYVSGKDLHAIFFDGLDVKQSNNELSITSEAVMPRRRPLGSVYKNCYPTGQVDGEMTITGWLDDVTSPQLGDLTGDSKVISVLYEGNAVSLHFAGFAAANVTGAKIGTAEDDLDTYEPVITANGRGPLIGYVVAPHAARTAAGNTDSAYATMNEASGVSGTAFLHVTAIDLGGYDDVTVKVRHSTDHITFADHTAFAAVTAVGAQTVALAATVNKYLSISHAYGGAGSDPTFTAFVGVAID
jgi:hypothetical protein